MVCSSSCDCRDYSIGVRRVSIEFLLLIANSRSNSSRPLDGTGVGPDWAVITFTARVSLSFGSGPKNVRICTAVRVAHRELCMAERVFRPRRDRPRVTRGGECTGRALVPAGDEAATGRGHARHSVNTG